MVSNYCTECVVNWWPYMTPEGRCPQCGSGTVRRQEPASNEALGLHNGIVGEAARRDLHARFEVYYAAREAKRSAGQVTDEFDALDEAA